MLAFGFRNFLFSGVTQQGILEFWVRHEAWPNFVIMHSFLALSGEVFGDVEVGQLGWLDEIGVDFEGESAEVAEIDAFAGSHVFLDVLAERLDD